MPAAYRRQNITNRNACLTRKLPISRGVSHWCVLTITTPRASTVDVKSKPIRIKTASHLFSSVKQSINAGCIVSCSFFTGASPSSTPSVLAMQPHFLIATERTYYWPLLVYGLYALQFQNALLTTYQNVVLPI